MQTHITALGLTLLGLVSVVLGHGYVSGIAIDGTWYAGNVPNNYKGSHHSSSLHHCVFTNLSGASPIRLVADISPVKGASNPDLICGLSAQLAELVAPANPGSVLAIQWAGGGGQNVSRSHDNSTSRSNNWYAVATQHRASHDIHDVLREYSVQPIQCHRRKLVQDRSNWAYAEWE